MVCVACGGCKGEVHVDAKSFIEFTSTGAIFSDSVFFDAMVPRETPSTNSEATDESREFRTGCVAADD